MTTATVNSVFERISKDPRWIQKVVIGGLLMFIPIINFFALGYLSRYAGQVLKNGSVKLPEWERWGRLFMGGLWFFLVILVYGVLTLVIGWMLGLLLMMISLGLLGWFPYFPLSVAILVAPTLVMCGLFTIRKQRSWDSLFSNVRDHFKKLCVSWKQLLVPNLAFVGLQLIGMPVYGLTFFLGLMVLIPYTALVFNQLDKEAK